MIQLPQEKLLERFDALPERLREAITSDEGLEMLLKIGEVHHLNDERTEKIIRIITYIILGATHIEDLSKEIVIETNVDKRLADELAREIQIKILAPVIPEIQQLYHYGSVGSEGTAPQASPITPPQSETLRPAFAPTQSDIRHRTSDVGTEPFVLREESEEPERVKPRDESLVRPSFYEGREAGNRKQEAGFERTAARLEIGPSLDLGRAEKKKPEVGKTEEPEIRVVHYSGPQTPVSPFGRQSIDTSNQSLEDQPSPPQKPPKDIHPENIIDLKDLPK